MRVAVRSCNKKQKRKLLDYNPLEKEGEGGSSQLQPKTNEETISLQRPQEIHACQLSPTNTLFLDQYIRCQRLLLDILYAPALLAMA